MAKSLELERGPAALEEARAVGARNAQHVAADVRAEARLLRVRHLLGKSKVCVHEERRAENIGAHHGGPVDVAVTLTRVAAAANRPPYRFLTEYGGHRRVEMEETEGTGEVELGIHVVVDLRVHLPAVGLERALGEVVAARPVDVVGGNVARDLLRDRIHPCGGNDVEALRIRRGVAQRVVRVAGKHLELRPPGAVRIPGERIVNRRI